MSYSVAKSSLSPPAGCVVTTPFVLNRNFLLLQPVIRSSSFLAEYCISMGNGSGQDDAGGDRIGEMGKERLAVQAVWREPDAALVRPSIL